MTRNGLRFEMVCGLWLRCLGNAMSASPSPYESGFRKNVYILTDRRIAESHRLGKLCNPPIFWAGDH
jgi:hypothetical protein